MEALIAIRSRKHERFVFEVGTYCTGATIDVGFVLAHTVLVKASRSARLFWAHLLIGLFKKTRKKCAFGATSKTHIAASQIDSSLCLSK